MITDIAEVNNFIVLIEQSNSKKIVSQKYILDDQLIGISFYGSAKVDLTVSFGKEEVVLNNTRGYVTSFFGNKNVRFSHQIYPEAPLPGKWSLDE